MSISTGDVARIVAQGTMASAPKLQRVTSGSLSLSTSWQRIDFATALVQEFPVITDAGLRTVDWDAGNKLLTFNDTVNRNYVAYFTLEHSATGVALPPIMPPVSVQLRYTVPDAGGAGVDFHFPNNGAASGNEYMDFLPTLANGTWVDHHPVHIPAGAVLRAHGAGIEVRLSASLPALATASVDRAIVYLVAS